MATDKDGVEIVEVVPEVEEEEPIVDNTKKFTQADVNRFILREKGKAKGYKEALETLQGKQDETLTQYEDTVGKIVTALLVDVPEPIKNLLTKLSPIEQLKYLNDPANNVLFEKTEFPLGKKKADKPVNTFIPTPFEKLM